MSIVHNIVTVHLHGTISVDSKVGEGTSVVICMSAIVPENSRPFRCRWRAAELVPRDTNDAPLITSVG
jgi:hypothetical protein